VLSLELIKVELLIEVVDDSALFELLSFIINVFKIIVNLGVDSIFSELILERLVNNITEAGTSLRDQTVGQSVEVIVVNDTDNFSSHILHIVKELVKLSKELSLGRIKLHTLS